MRPPRRTPLSYSTSRRNAGYTFGSLLARPSSPAAAASATAARRVPRRPLAPTLVLGLGLALTLAFVVLRAIDAYGDPSRWSPLAVLRVTRRARYLLAVAGSSRNGIAVATSAGSLKIV
jgi:hypothetical protein